MKKGMGEHQQAMILTADITLINALKDFQWHTYSELKSKTKLSSATLTKHLKKNKDWLDKKIDLESGKYPYPVHYRLNSKIQFLISTGNRVQEAISSVQEALDAAKNEKEYLEILTEYFENGILSLQRHTVEQKDLTPKETDTMIKWFMAFIEPVIKVYLHRFGNYKLKV